MNDPPASRLGAAKATLFSLLTLALILCAVEGGWRLVCLLGWTLPPSGDRSLDKEWEWVAPRLARGADEPLKKGPNQHDPELGWMLWPGYRDADNTISASGHRGTTEWRKERAPGKKRILFLGDSYTYGWEVKDNESYPAVLAERFLPDVEIINWGIPGYGTDQMLLLWEKHGVSYSPDVVVIGFYTRDIARNQLRFYSFLKPCFTLEGDNLTLATGTIPSPTELYSDYVSGKRRIATEGLFLSAYFKRKLQEIERKDRGLSEMEWRVTEKILDRLIAGIREAGAVPFVLFIPDDEVLKREGTDTEVIVSRLVAWAKRAKADYLDLCPILRAKAKESPGPLYQGHWTALGHAAVAEALFHALQARGIP
ncbi:MAG: hypothetical protein HUU16_01685 [Candidatus Omnitrophica bacterium]|nr:hypothetical protein [bacterium]NUN94859.1 hypothetical protein [Candidatus Omnitrophota bacterium]